MTLLPSSDAYFLRHPVPLVAQAHARAKERRARLEAMVERAKRQAPVLALAAQPAEVPAPPALSPKIAPQPKLSGLPLIHQIQRVVARIYDISVRDMLSKNRRPNVVHPRMIAFYLARAMTAKSFPEIGRRFGGFDHTTILHAIGKIEKMKAADCDFAREVDALVIAIGGDG